MSFSDDEDVYWRQLGNRSNRLGMNGVQIQADYQAKNQKVVRRKSGKNVRFEGQTRIKIGDDQSQPRGSQGNQVDRMARLISPPTVHEQQHRCNDPRDCRDEGWNQAAPTSHMNQAPKRDVSATQHLSPQTSTDDSRLFFELDVTSDDPQNHARLPAQRPTATSNQHHSRTSLEETQELHIVLSSSSTDAEGEESIEFWHMDDVPQETFTHWQHIERPFMDLERFKDLALQTPHVKDSQMLSTIVQRLMDEVAKRFSKPSRQGKGALHGVFRCDVPGAKEDAFPNVAATWLCFPYLLRGDGYADGISAAECRGLCRTRTLFQWSYGNELILEREEKQAFKEKTGELLYVPQVWILLLGKDTIVSSSPCSLWELLPTKLTHQPVPSTPGRHLLMWIKLIDHRHREVIVPFDHCASFQALQILVAETCLAGKQTNPKHYLLYVDGNPLTASLWLYLTRSAKSPTLVVWIVKSHDDSSSTSTTISIEEDVDGEDEQTSKSPNDRRGGRNKGPVIGDAGMSVAMDEITQTALSRIRPFLCWDLSRNDSATNPRNQEEKENDVIDIALSRVKDAQNHFPSNHPVPTASRREYLEENLYAEMSTARLQQFELFEANHRDGSTTTFPCEYHKFKAAARPKDPSECQCQNCQKRKLILRIIQSTKRIVSLFVSSQDNHKLLQKMWGALEALLSSNTNISPSSEHKRRLQRWTVLGSPDEVAEMRRLYDIPRPDRRPEDICKPCQNGQQYDTPEEAAWHLMTEHYSKSIGRLRDRPQAIHLLTAGFEQVWAKRLEETQWALLKVLIDRLDDIQRVAHGMKTALAKGIGDKQPSYTLPDSMIEAMRCFVYLMLASGHTATLIYSAFEDWVPYKSMKTEVPRVDEYISLVDGVGKDTEASMLRVWEDISLMIKDDLKSSRKVYTGVGTRFTTSNMLQHLLERPVWHDQSTVELYAKMISELEYHVFNDRPRRRLFSQIYLLQEDIRALSKVRKAQYDVLNDLRQVFNPDTFTIIEPTEVVQCRLSLPVVQSAIESAQFDLKELELILEKSLDLERRAKHRIEILEEDHGKAIFVFTLVTAIFLPLSFVSSYMGMNTADIRDMGATQDRFWAVAIPVTVTVMGIATFLAYKGDLIRKWLLFEAMQSTSRRESAKKELSRSTGRGEKVLQENPFAFGRSWDVKWWRSGKVEEAR